jgi:hypothetical protein
LDRTTRPTVGLWIGSPIPIGGMYVSLPSSRARMAGSMEK